MVFAKNKSILRLNFRLICTCSLNRHHVDSRFDLSNLHEARYAHESSQTGLVIFNFYENYSLPKINIQRELMFQVWSQHEKLRPMRKRVFRFPQPNTDGFVT